MICIFCSGITEVSNTRPRKKSPGVWRRRRCSNCKKDFTTREKPDLSLSVLVKSENGLQEPFSEDKLLLSVHSCLSHRKDASEASRALSETITKLLLPCLSDGSIKRLEIARTTHKVLSRFDKPAAVFYQSHHQMN